MHRCQSKTDMSRRQKSLQNSSGCLRHQARMSCPLKRYWTPQKRPRNVALPLLYASYVYCNRKW